jgi:GT2 family glycosyltransferase
MKPAEDNPKGFWEHDLLTALNDEILAKLGGSWHEPPIFPSGWERSPQLADLRQRARAILQEDFGTAELWGWKDPRTCLTLPFWQKLLPAMRYVICLRNPVDVARSLERRNSFPFEKGIKLWLTHVISALQHTAGQPRLFVFYEDIMENWPREVRRLAGFLGRPELVEQKAIQQSIQEFIEEELQHHRTSLIDAADEPKLSFPAKALYMVLRTYATYQQQKPNLEVEDSTLQTAIDVFSSYTLEAATEQEKLTQLVTVLREQVAQSEQQIGALQAQLQAERERLTQQVAEKEQAIQQLQSQLAERERVVTVLREQVAQNEQQIGALQAQLQAERERLTQQVAEKEQAIQQLQSQLAERDQFIHSITGSRAWLLVRFLWWLRPRVAPDGSWRQRFLYSVLRLTGFVLRRARKWVSGLWQWLKGSSTLLRRSPLSSTEIHFPQDLPPHMHGYIDQAQISENGIVLIGWLFHERKGIYGVHLMVESQGKIERFIGLYGLERMDVYRDFPYDHARNSGFWIHAAQKLGGLLTFTLEIQFRDTASQRLPLGRVKISPPSFLSRLFRLIRMANKRNLRLALRYVRNGNWSYLFHRLKIGLGFSEQNPKALSLGAVLKLVDTEPSRIEPLTQEIDIVIPVYNGIEHLEKLMSNLFKNTSEPYRLIIIDDASSDPRIWPYLTEIAHKRPNTVLLRNEINKGFPAAVNLGIKHTRNHFVILNTDVEVPPGWLERLMRPILKNPEEVASTTPFTNSGTICSFPKFLKDNELFENMTVEEIDRFFAQVKAEMVEITLPSGVGFCMGVNKNAIKKVGLLDEKTFGRGYGEENDWCMRARYKGYKHMMVTNLFVYHKHGAIFGSEEKRRLFERNWELLVRRHPEYPALVERHIAEDPVGPIRDFLFLLIACHRGAILIFDHELGGGANRYRSQLIEEKLSQNQAILLYAENPSQLEPRIRCYYKQHSVEFSVSSLGELLELAKRVRLSEIFYNNAVSYVSPLLVSDLMTELKQSTQARLILAIHDYYPVCPSYNLINNQGVFCGIPDIRRCKECLPNNRFVAMTPSVSVSIEEWRAKWGQCLSEADTILCFSHSSVELVRRAYPNLDPAKFMVCPHQVKISRKPRINFNAELRIGVVGAINYAKGAHIVEEMARLLRDRGLATKIYVIGTFTGNTSEEIIVTGPYRREELPDIIEELGVNVFLVPSIVPETFSYVTEELIQMEVPLAVFDLGAPAERVSRYPYGRVIRQINAETALDTLIELYHAMKRGYIA